MSLREPTTVVVGTVESDRRPQARFMHGPIADIALAFVWVPFVVVTHLLGTRGAVDALAVFITAVFVLSFAHQPLTVALVYGDPDQFRLRRAIFTWSPLVFVAAIVAGYQISFVLVAVVGGLWNAEHTLMQRYGVTRIYGRMAGQQDGWIEKAMLFSWLILALVWVAADVTTPARVAAVPFGANNTAAINVLSSFQSAASIVVWPAVAVVVALIVGWFHLERLRQQHNVMKWIYLGSTAALFALVLVDPLAAIMGYIGAHAVEYFVVVHHSLGRRYAPPSLEVDDRRAASDDDRDPATGGLLGRAVRTRIGPIGFLAIYVAIVLSIVFVLQRLGSPLLYAVVFFTLGGMHVFYDGFIWKLRRPIVAQSLAIPSR